MISESEAAWLAWLADRQTAENGWPMMQIEQIMEIDGLACKVA